MKVTTTCNLKGKTRTWRKGTEIEEPFPPDIAEEIKAVQEGRSDALTVVILDKAITESNIAIDGLIKAIDPGLRGSAVGTALRQTLNDRAILFRKFDRPVLNCYGCAPKQIEYQSSPWFFNQAGAKKKRQLLLRKFK